MMTVAVISIGTFEDSRIMLMISAASSTVDHMRRA